MRKRKFYKANLPTVVWDPQNDRALAEFIEGQYVTKSERVAARLIELGYPEVELDAEVPPVMPEPAVQPVKDKDIPLAGAFAKGAPVVVDDDDDDEQEIQPEGSTSKTGTKKAAQTRSLKGRQKGE